MIDWKKPLVCNSFADPKVHFIGFTPNNCHAVIMSTTGTLYKVDLNTSRIVGSNADGCKVENQKEPWEKAWEKYNKPSYFYKNEEDWFKEVFNLGLEWQENQNKKC
jgi:hypothetical protein